MSLERIDLDSSNRCSYQMFSRIESTFDREQDSGWWLERRYDLAHRQVQRCHVRCLFQMFSKRVVAVARQGLLRATQVEAVTAPLLR